MGAKPPKPGAVVAVRVTARTSRDAVGEWREGRLEVRVTAPPVEGRANAAVCRLLAALLGIAPSRVRVIHGERGREKRVHVSGLSTPAVLQLLHHPGSE